MTEAIMCKGTGCQKQLRPQSKWGYCKSCQRDNVDNCLTRIKRFKATGSWGDDTRYCMSCSKRLHNGNRLGYCKTCHGKNVDNIKTIQSARIRGGKTREEFQFKECKGCKITLKKETRWGYCRKCFKSNKDGIRTEVEHSLPHQLRRWRNKLGVIITDEEAQEYWDKTHCDFCGEEMILQGSPTDIKAKVMDHCHDSMRYRGALHRGCNSAIGHLGDDLTKIIERAYNYQQLSVGRCESER